MTFTPAEKKSAKEKCITMFNTIRKLFKGGDSIENSNYASEMTMQFYQQIANDFKENCDDTVATSKLVKKYTYISKHAQRWIAEEN